MIGFIYQNKAEVTVIVSKSGGRYRVQSNDFQAIMFISNTMINKLKEIYQYDIKVHIEDDLHLKEYLVIVENHFNAFVKKKNINLDIEKYTNLYTIVQKCLLNKYKEKTPPSLNNLDFLQRNIYKNIDKLSEDLLKNSDDIVMICRELLIWTENILFLLKLK